MYTISLKESKYSFNEEFQLIANDRYITLIKY